MNPNQAIINHPIWDKLRALDKLAARRFPCDCDQGFGSLGLILHVELGQYEYWCTPTNALSFASTGGNGVHFSFLVQGGKVTEASPIVITVPCTYDHPNFIVGESLFDFLCLGYHRGYFALENLPADKCFDAYASDEWQPKEDWEYAVGFGVSEHQRKLLDFLVAKLGLSPWTDLKRKFQRLQTQYMPLLEIPEGGEPLE